MSTLYVTDLDGTLLNSSDRISQYSIETINGLVAKGMQFTYATARSLVSASVVAKGLATTIPVIAYNGALIVDPDTGRVNEGIRRYLDVRKGDRRFQPLEDERCRCTLQQELCG